MNIKIEGIGPEGITIFFECDLYEGTITENGHCRFVGLQELNDKRTEPKNESKP